MSWLSEGEGVKRGRLLVVRPLPDGNDTVVTLMSGDMLRLQASSSSVQQLYCVDVLGEWPQLPPFLISGGCVPVCLCV